MTTMQATIPGVMFHGAEVEVGAAFEVETDDDRADIEVMFQRGGVVVVNSAPEGPHHRRGTRTPPMTTETGPNPTAKPEPDKAEERSHRAPGARPEGYGRRDMKPSDK